jgi:hypothetical protein
VDRNTKLVTCISLLLASTFFLSITTLEQRQRNDRLLRLSDDEWCRQRIAEAFPDFPVTSYLGNVSNTAEELTGGINHRPDMAKIVERITGQHPAYFRWFTVSQREPDPLKWDPTNHHHVGFITSDLEVYDLGLDVLLQ